MTVDVLGVPFRVGFGDGIAEADAARITRSWQRCAVDPDDDDILVRAVVGGAPAPEDADDFVVRASTLAQLEETLTSSLTIRAIGERKDELLMLHACGVADENGRVVALVAASGTGKTTAARVLGTHYRYVSDETVALARDGSVVAYPKPLSVKQHGEPQPKVQLAPDDAELRPLSGAPLTLAAIVMLDRREGAVQATLESVRSADALCELVPQTSYLSARERPLAELLGVFAERGGVRRVIYSEADSLPPLIDRILAEPAPDAVAIGAEFEIVDLGAPVDRAVPATAAVRRVPVDDAVLADDGDLLIFVANSVVRLSGIGPLIWDIAQDWVDVDAVTAAVLDALGAPPEGVDADTAVHSTLTDMVRAGVLETSAAFAASSPPTSPTDGDAG